MTVGQALERAEELRPGSRIALATRQAWLKEADAMLRERFFKNSITDAYDDVGADLAWDDSLQDDDVLLAPAPFDALYPHYLCAMTTEITAIRRTLTPVVEQICRMWLRMQGYARAFHVDWDDINLQDEVEEAKAELYREQARKLRIENDREENRC